MRLQRKDSGEEMQNFALSSSLHCSSTNSICSEGRSIIHRQIKGGGEKLEIRSQRLDVCEMGGKLLPQKDNNPNASVEVQIVRGTSSKARKMHKLTNSQLSLPQAQLNLEGSDVRVHVCHENFFAL